MRRTNLSLQSLTGRPPRKSKSASPRKGSPSPSTNTRCATPPLTPHSLPKMRPTHHAAAPFTHASPTRPYRRSHFPPHKQSTPHVSEPPPDPTVRSPSPPFPQIGIFNQTDATASEDAAEAPSVTPAEPETETEPTSTNEEEEAAPSEEASEEASEEGASEETQSSEEASEEGASEETQSSEEEVDPESEQPSSEEQPAHMQRVNEDAGEEPVEVTRHPKTPQ
eukprot:1159361-Prorocentrum_minimum.AAC.1